MAAPSPNIGNIDLVSFDILSNGKNIPDTYQVISMSIEKKVNSVPYARIVLSDGSPAEPNFTVSDSSTFIPGNNIEIKLGYHSKNTSVFKGIITKQNIKVSRGNGSVLEVICNDLAIKMTVGRKNTTYLKVKDSDVFGKIINSYGLIKNVAATNNIIPELTQYYTTDWDFVLSRAKVNGMVIIAGSNKVTIQKPDTGTTPVLELTYGDSILDMNLDLDATTQLSNISASSWDISAQKVQTSGPSAVSIKEPGNISSNTLSKVIDLKTYLLQTDAPVNKVLLQTWAAAQKAQSILSKVTGTVSFQGSSLAEPGKMITLSDVGDRFNGNAFISGVTHTVDNGNWITETELGLPFDDNNSGDNNISAPVAAGLIPAIQGLHNGVVLKTGKDPDGQFRVQVKIPLISDTPVWARLSNIYASNKIGICFYPEPGDEVLIAFINNDPCFPIILGSLYSKKHSPPFVPDEKNSQKGIVTKSKLQLTFDDNDKVTVISTPGKNKIELNDKTGAITISDSNKNSVTLSKSGISINSAANLTLKAKGNITLDAGGNLTAKASANHNISGLQVAINAKAKAALKGNASTEVTSSGIVDIKGTIVKIN